MESTPTEPASDTFTVSFRTASLDVERMVVKCHKGGLAQGDEVKVISQAGKGPCRVEAGLNGEKMVVSVVVTGPQDFTCFEDNARVCR